MSSLFRAGRRCVLAAALSTTAAAPGLARAGVTSPGVTSPGVASPGVTSPAVKSGQGNAVPACATADRLLQYLKSRNPELPEAFNTIAVDYQREGHSLGVRWDYAFFQMMVDTANLSFRRPNGGAAAVRPKQNNFAGIGATGGAERGESFPDVATGVRAHLQHVLLYSGTRISAPVAERTRKVQAWGILGPWQRQLGRPVTFTDLAAKWSPADPAYGASIDTVAQRFYSNFCGLAVPVPVLVTARTLAPATTNTASAVHRPAQAAFDPPPETKAAQSQLPLPQAPADPEADAIRTLVTGRTFVLDASFGTKLPISFRSDGTMQGKAGSLSMMLGSAADEGKWWVEKGRLCQRWKVWLERETQCLRLRRIGEVIHWTRDDGKTGTARMATR
jgi:Mannosyl-glycoprotein endo-beta-N-acetylglucosaminidase